MKMNMNFIEWMNHLIWRLQLIRARDFDYGEEGIFTGTVKEYGYTYTYCERSILLLDVADDNGQLRTHHMWMAVTNDFNAEIGCIIRFYGKAVAYEKSERQKVNGKIKNSFDLNLKCIEIIEIID